MKAAIMQPYFFPYLGYFSLIKHTDIFILFDTPQFIRHGWIERNRILKPNGEPLYIKVPLEKHSRDTTIDNILINNSIEWEKKILAQIVPYKKTAPNYWEVLKLLNEIFEFKTKSIVEFNFFSLRKTCEFLGINTPIKIWSHMNVTIEQVNEPDEWALKICKTLDIDTYYNPVGGTSFFNKNKYEKSNIDLNFLKLDVIEYKQFGNDFMPFLSILDALMFCSVSKVNNMIDNFKFVE